MNAFDYGIIGLLALGFVCFMLWPYFSLTYLRDIANELEGIKEEMEKLNEGICKRN